MKSICGFIPSKNDSGNLKTVHFVYEAEYQKLRWPLVSHIYYVFLVVKGTGRLILPEFGSHALKRGTLFFVLPGVRYEITGDDDLSYMYISFMGVRAPELLSSLNVSMDAPVYSSFEEHIPLWKQAIQRVGMQNANLITEGILLYTLSYLSAPPSSQSAAAHANALQDIVNYVDHNFCNVDVSLKKTAEIFGYSDKYLSHLFKKEMNVNWSIYLNRLRIRHAIRQIEDGQCEVSLISESCGYTDPLYFSKVFKRMVGKTPHVCIKEQSKK